MTALFEQRGIVSIGYEGQNLDEFIAKLTKIGACVLVDVRLNPISRKPGFSKRILGESLAKAGIAYWHMPELGNPKWNRAGFGGSPADVNAARERFAEMIGSEASEKRVGEIADASLGGVVAVMCFEADERSCHRYVVIREAHRRLALCRTVA
jgi:uncharacterized protein (DUF488 family)